MSRSSRTGRIRSRSTSRTAEEALENHDDTSGEPEPVFYQFHDEILGLEPGVIRDGLEKFGRFTVVEMNPLECEDHYDYVRDFYWILSDGSILSHDAQPECD
jgi:hypothetical protein